MQVSTTWLCQNIKIDFRFASRSVISDIEGRGVSIWCGAVSGGVEEHVEERLLIFCWQVDPHYDAKTFEKEWEDDSLATSAYDGQIFANSWPVEFDLRSNCTVDSWWLL